MQVQQMRQAVPAAPRGWEAWNASSLSCTCTSSCHMHGILRLRVCGADVDAAAEYRGPKWWEAWDEPEEQGARKRQRGDATDQERGQRSAEQLRQLHALPIQVLPLASEGTCR